MSIWEFSWVVQHPPRGLMTSSHLQWQKCSFPDWQGPNPPGHSSRRKMNGTTVLLCFKDFAQAANWPEKTEAPESDSNAPCEIVSLSMREGKGGCDSCQSRDQIAAVPIGKQYKWLCFWDSLQQIQTNLVKLCSKWLVLLLLTKTVALFSLLGFQSPANPSHPPPSPYFVIPLHFCAFYKEKKKEKPRICTKMKLLEKKKKLHSYSGQGLQILPNYLEKSVGDFKPQELRRQTNLESIIS